MKTFTMRWLAGAATAGLAVTALAAPVAQAAPPADGFFCSDGTQPMVTQDEVTSSFDSTTEVKGLTVVQGTTPVEFTGTYTGHLENVLGKGVDMLLFELTGAGVDSGTTPAGIWAGMSGSPVYTQDGRLIGAVAYGLSPDNIPIAGVTPADYMKAVGTDRLASPAKVSITKRNLEGVSGRRAAALVGQQPQRLKAVKVATGGMRINKDVNRMLGRIPGRSASAKSLRAGGFAPVGAPVTIPEPLVPGGNIAVGYGTGDLFAGGVGTVTAICGSTVWAFGHAMDFMGDTSLSMHNASAALIVRDSTGWSGSYKQVSKVGQQVGTITKDGWGAIRGELGLVTGFPVTTTVKNSRGAVLDTYRGTVVDPWTADLAAMAPMSAVYDIIDNFGIGTARHQWRIDYRLGNGRTGTLKNAQVHSGLGDLADLVAGDLGNDVGMLAYTDLADVTITAVTSTLTLTGQTAVDYRFAGAKLWNGSKWVKLKGKKLKAKRTHTVRPVIRQYVNGKPRAKSMGPSVTFKIGKLAGKRGKVTFSPRADAAGEECFDVDGETICVDFEDSEDSEAGSFGELLKELDAVVPADRAQALVEWPWKSGKAKGSTKKQSRFVAPGVISGSYKATFRIRH